ncbi:hypothetical protein ACHAPC_011127 [Botrytis cinerea]
MSEYIETVALSVEKETFGFQTQVTSVSQSDPSMSDTSQADDIAHEGVSSQPSTVYLKGARLHIITAAIFLSLFITNLEIPIVTTSLVSITDDLNSFNEVNWIASAYMLGEVITSISLFTIFAGACGISQSMTQLSLFSTNVFKRVDLLGAVILLVAIALLVAALEEAGQLYEWRSAFVVVLLTISGISWICFVFWERLVSLESQTAEPVFPWRLMTSRIWIGMILNAVFLGIPYFVTIFQLPQRFQVVDNTTALNAAFRLIPFTLLCPVGSIVSTVVAGKAKVPPIFFIMIGSGLQVVGFALLSTLTISEVVPVSQYGFQVIAGFGVGINLSTLLLITPYSISEPADKAVAVSSITQFRILGGVLGIAIATAAYKSNIISNLDKILTKEQRLLILESTSMIKTFDPDVQLQIRSIFAEGYNLQFRILVAFAAAQIPSSLLMWQEKQIVV